ncbi:energy transducer TonB [Hahella ganghwensis]|uniref:energy transducer TonB n=1 Tax=Hahella ganghwensis TaxID=286420 RepID=UPI0012FBE4D9|nr:energy transducer TonB [Hahella ganghwensis]
MAILLCHAGIAFTLLLKPAIHRPAAVSTAIPVMMSVVVSSPSQVLNDTQKAKTVSEPTTKTESPQKQKSKPVPTNPLPQMEPSITDSADIYLPKRKDFKTDTDEADKTSEKISPDINDEKPTPTREPEWDKPESTSPPSAPRSTQVSQETDLSVAPAQSYSVAKIATAKYHWQSELMAYLAREKHYPRLSRKKREQGTVIARFVINRQGQLLQAELLQPTQYTALNQEAINLLHRASPLPPPPNEVPGAEVELVVPIEFLIR